jgi:acetyltransferase-like isoleucine patch superfamily enzyme
MPDWRRVPWELRYRYGAQLAWRARRALLEATHLHANLQFQGPVRLGPMCSLDIAGPGTLVVGPGVDFRRGFHCEISGDGRVEIGAGAIFTSYALVQCTTSIEIGERCVFGQNLLLADGNHRYGDPDKHLLDQGYDFRPVRIGAGAVVTSKCTILADIGEQSLIGANSVVTKPVPAFCLAVGAPAKVVQYFGPPELRPAELDASLG